MVEEDIEREHAQCERDAQKDVRARHRKDAAEHIAVDIRGHAGRERGDDDADGERRG